MLDFRTGSLECLLQTAQISAHFQFCLAEAVTNLAFPFAVTPISTPGCLYQFGIYPESAECSNNYIKCAHGVPHTTPCEPGLAYDDKTHSCNWPDLLLDFCNPEGNLPVSAWKCYKSSNLQQSFFLCNPVPYLLVVCLKTLSVYQSIAYSCQ